MTARVSLLAPRVRIASMMRGAVPAFVIEDVPAALVPLLYDTRAAPSRVVSAAGSEADARMAA
jgi:hypothetical protein